MFGKWHLGEGKAHQPSGFDEWEIVRGQGEYYDPVFDTPTGPKQEIGYATDIITDKTLAFIENRDVEKPFFVMCHHKAPHRWVLASSCHSLRAHHHPFILLSVYVNGVYERV